MSEQPIASPGEIIAERFRIEAPIGDGGMGAVFRAVQLGLERPVALKLILPERAGSERAQRRFLREARVTAAVKHPGVVQIFDYGQAGDTVFIAMELLSGPTLRSVVDTDLPPLPWKRAVAIGGAIADALSAVAATDLVHRDLKPENVVFDGDERIVLVDFGLAFAIDGDGATGRVTREGVLSGTPDYMAPEQCSASEVGPAADVYALGCMLYEMLTSEAPFTGEAAMVLSRHLFIPPKPMRERPKALAMPGALEDLVMEMLRKHAHERPSASVVSQRLARIASAGPERKSGKTVKGEAVGRAARMVSGGSIHPGALPDQNLSGTVCWLGPLDEATEEALIVSGARVVRAPGTQDLLVVAEDDIEAVRAHAQNGPVLALAPSLELSAITGLMRAGAADSFHRDASTEDILRKVTRLLRKKAL